MLMKKQKNSRYRWEPVKKNPSFLPSFPPSLLPSFPPSLLPSLLPSLPPSLLPSFLPSVRPSFLPSLLPSFLPSFLPFLLYGHLFFFWCIFFLMHFYFYFDASPWINHLDSRILRQNTPILGRRSLASWVETPAWIRVAAQHAATWSAWPLLQRTIHIHQPNINIYIYQHISTYINIYHHISTYIKTWIKSTYIIVYQHISKLGLNQHISSYISILMKILGDSQVDEWPTAETPTASLPSPDRNGVLLGLSETFDLPEWHTTPAWKMAARHDTSPAGRRIYRSQRWNIEIGWDRVRLVR